LDSPSSAPGAATREMIARRSARPASIASLPRALRPLAALGVINRQPKVVDPLLQRCDLDIPLVARACCLPQRLAHTHRHSTVVDVVQLRHGSTSLCPLP
jgi:hypothetical protein